MHFSVAMFRGVPVPSIYSNLVKRVNDQTVGNWENGVDRFAQWTARATSVEGETANVSISAIPLSFFHDRASISSERVGRASTLSRVSEKVSVILSFLLDGPGLLLSTRSPGYHSEIPSARVSSLSQFISITCFGMPLFRVVAGRRPRSPRRIFPSSWLDRISRALIFSLVEPAN